MKQPKPAHLIALLVTCAVCCNSNTSSWAQTPQDAPPAEPTPPPTGVKKAEPAPASPSDAKPQTGEIRLDGKIIGRNGANGFVLEVFGFTTAAGKSGVLPEPKPKNVLIDAQTVLHIDDDPSFHVKAANLHLGTRVTVIGRDLGSGRDLPAREVIVRDDETMTQDGDASVMVSKEAAPLVEAARRARSMRDYERASRLLQQALTAGRSYRQGGEALIWSDLGSLYREMGRMSQSLQAFEHSLAAFRLLDDVSGQASTLNDMALVLEQINRMPEAVETFERALGLDQSKVGRRDRIAVLTNYAGACAHAAQFDKALASYRRALPLLRAERDVRGEAEALLAMAFLTEPREALDLADQAVRLLPRVVEVRDRASLFSLAADFYKRLPQQPARAMELYRMSLALYQEAADARGIADAQAQIASLERGRQ